MDEERRNGIVQLLHTRVNDDKQVLMSMSERSLFHTAIQGVNQVRQGFCGCLWDSIRCCSPSCLHQIGCQNKNQRAKKRLLKHFETELDIRSLVNTAVSLRQALHFILDKN